MLVVVSKISSALPPFITFGAAVAVRTTLPPDKLARALEASLGLGRAAAGRMVETGTLGSTTGRSAGLASGAPVVLVASPHAAGVLKAVDA